MFTRQTCIKSVQAVFFYGHRIADRKASSPIAQRSIIEAQSLTDALLLRQTIIMGLRKPKTRGEFNVKSHNLAG